MNCPKCNSEMTLGYLQSPRGLIWAIKRHKIFIAPNTKKGEVWVGSEDNSFGTLVKSFRCPECETIVMLPPMKK